MRLYLAKKWWQLRFVPNLGARGDCDDPSQLRPHKAGQIRIKASLVGRERLEVLLHEMLHASAWPLDESCVTRFAADAARALWRLGYRDQEG